MFGQPPALPLQNNIRSGKAGEKKSFYIQKKTGRDGVGRCCIWVWTIVDIREKRNLFESVGTKKRISGKMQFSKCLFQCLILGLDSIY